MSRAWYQLALAAQASAPATPKGAGKGAAKGAEAGAVRLVAAQGDHLGEAIEAAQKASPGQIVVGARLCSSPPLGDSVGKSRRVVEQAAAEGAGPLVAPAFQWPAGVVPELGTLEPEAAGSPGGSGGLSGGSAGGARGSGASAGASPGYVVSREGKLSIVEAQVRAGELGEAFLGWIEKLPTADNLEVRLLHYFEEKAQTEVWLTPRIGVKQVLRFLDAHDRELIDNGFVELAVYLRQEGSTLRLTEHKTLVWTSFDDSTVARTEQTLAALGVRRADKLFELSPSHFHSRPAGTRPREALGKYLYKQRLRMVDRLDEQGHSLQAQTTAAAATPKK